MTTTLAGTPVTNPTNPAEPSGWFQLPSTAKITNMPGYLIVNDLFDSYGLPEAIGWAGFCLLLSALFGLLAYSTVARVGYSSAGLWAALIVSSLFIVVGWWMGVVPLWLFLIIMVVEGSLAYRRSS
jgi:hypothetical protein